MLFGFADQGERGGEIGQRQGAAWTRPPSGAAGVRSRRRAGAPERGRDDPVVQHAVAGVDDVHVDREVISTVAPIGRLPVQSATSSRSSRLPRLATASWSYTASSSTPASESVSDGGRIVGRAGVGRRDGVANRSDPRRRRSCRRSWPGRGPGPRRSTVLRAARVASVRTVRTRRAREHRVDQRPVAGGREAGRHRVADRRRRSQSRVAHSRPGCRRHSRRVPVAGDRVSGVGRVIEHPAEQRVAERGRRVRRLSGVRHRHRVVHGAAGGHGRQVGGLGDASAGISTRTGAEQRRQRCRRPGRCFPGCWRSPCSSAACRRCRGCAR